CCWLIMRPGGLGALGRNHLALGNADGLRELRHQVIQERPHGRQHSTPIWKEGCDGRAFSQPIWKYTDKRTCAHFVSTDVRGHSQHSESRARGRLEGRGASGNHSWFKWR